MKELRIGDRVKIIVIFHKCTSILDGTLGTLVKIVRGKNLYPYIVKVDVGCIGVNGTYACHRVEGVEEIAEFSLPEKWCILTDIYTEPTVANWYNKMFNRHVISSGDGLWWYANDENTYVSRKRPHEYTEITYKQFLKYVLNLDNKMEKQLIGYKLKSEEYRLPASKVLGLGHMDNFNGTYISVQENIDRARALNILDVWFEPAYMERKPSIMIKGFEAIKSGNEIKIGCQFFGRQELLAYKRLFIIGKTTGEDVNITVGNGVFRERQVDELLALLEDNG